MQSDPGILGGTLVFRHTRVPAQTLLDYLDDGFSMDQFLEFFPSVAKPDAVEFLKLARDNEDHFPANRTSACTVAVG